MDKRVKFSLKTRLSTVRSIMEEGVPCRTAARKLGCSKNTVKRWLLHYQHSGIDGLKNRNASYKGAFKVEVIRYMLKNRLSLMRTAAFFGIPSISVVYRWQQIYEQLGIPGLLKETRAAKKLLMPKKKTNSKETNSKDSSAEKLAALEKEVEYLRAENAFLKKLEALIQQEKAAKAQSKRQKSSRN